MEFQGEQLIWGNIGHACVLLSFVASLLGCVAFFLSEKSKLIANQSYWYKLGQSSFYVHSAAVFSIFCILFYLIFNHRYEYHYVWSHSNNELPFKYLLSCFWEGQEGSFLLWLIWHSVLGIFFMSRKKTKWSAGVMTVVSLAQFFLSISLLGLFFFGEKIGSSPFALLRHEMATAPIFQRADYLTLINDGNGLNPLLQNYWMVIHPPILFLGFASTLWPFAFAIAALWKNDYKDWVKPVIRWSLFGSMILGTGIIMGGAWAYESLNFGGYWAWDPVENASLVPWLVLIAGLHTVVIYKATGYSLRSTLFFFILSFALVLYSTFLTRTGILGDTSVHAFTGEGNYLGIYLLLFLGVFLIGGVILFLIRYKSLPDKKKEEEISSREFWMFIGALVLIISSVQITYATSLPVWNKIFGTKLAITDPVSHYNSIQIWFAVTLALGTAIVYFLKFKQTNWTTVFKKLSIPILASVLISALVIYFQELYSVPVAILAFCSVFTVIANGFYIAQNKKGNLIKWGGNLAHVGFGLMLVGIVLSSYNKNVISLNNLGVELPLGKESPEENEKESRENVLLFRGKPTKMDDYWVTYTGDTTVGPNHYYNINYVKKENEKIVEEFTLVPNAQLNPKMGLVANPDTKHYWTKDVFTYLTTAIDKSKIKDTSTFKSRKVQIGDSIYFANGVMVFQGFDPNISHPSYKAQKGDVAVSAKLAMMDLQGNKATVSPVYYIRNGSEFRIIDTLTEFELQVRIGKIIPEEEAVQIEYKQPEALNDYITMKAIVFPYINFLWLGVVLMILGFLFSLLKRFREK